MTWVSLREVSWGPGSARKQYNTAVVFDASGALVARYRKQHLWGEPAFDAGPAGPVARVKLFGVTFGLVICADVVRSEGRGSRGLRARP